MFKMFFSKIKESQTFLCSLHHLYPAHEQLRRIQTRADNRIKYKIKYLLSKYLHDEI